MALASDAGLDEIVLIREKLAHTPWQHAELIREQVEYHSQTEAQVFSELEIHSEPALAHITPTYNITHIQIIAALFLGTVFVACIMLKLVVSRVWQKVRCDAKTLNKQSIAEVLQGMEDALLALPFTLSPTSVSIRYVEARARWARVGFEPTVTEQEGPGYVDSSKIASSIYRTRVKLRNWIEHFEENVDVSIISAEVLLQVLQETTELSMQDAYQSVNCKRITMYKEEDVRASLAQAVTSNNERKLLESISIAEVFEFTSLPEFEGAEKELIKLYKNEDESYTAAALLAAQRDMQLLSRMFNLQRGESYGQTMQLLPPQKLTIQQLTVDLENSQLLNNVGTLSDLASNSSCARRFTSTDEEHVLVKAVKEHTEAASTTPWMLEAYRLQREHKERQSERAENRRRERKLARENALNRAQEEKRRLAQEILTYDLSVRSLQKQEQMSCAMDMAQLENLKRMAKNSLKEQKHSQHLFERTLLLLLCCLNLAVFLGWYMKFDYFTSGHSASFGDALFRYETRMVLRSTFHRCLTHFCTCLEKPNGYGDNVIPEPLSPVYSVHHDQLTKPSFSTPVKRYGWSNLSSGTTEELIHAYISGLGWSFLYSVAKRFGLAKLLRIPSALFCIGRLLARLTLPICLSYPWKFFGLSTVGNLVFWVLSWYSLRVALWAAVGPTYPVFMWMLVQVLCLATFQFFDSKGVLRWMVPVPRLFAPNLVTRRSPTFVNCRPAVMCIVVPAVSVFASYALGLRASQYDARRTLV